jgi:hypothetical protein
LYEKIKMEIVSNVVEHNRRIIQVTDILLLKSAKHFKSQNFIPPKRASTTLNEPPTNFSKV